MEGKSRKSLPDASTSPVLAKPPSLEDSENPGFYASVLSPQPWRQMICNKKESKEDAQ